MPCPRLRGHVSRGVTVHGSLARSSATARGLEAQETGAEPITDDVACLDGLVPGYCPQHPAVVRSIISADELGVILLHTFISPGLERIKGSRVRPAVIWFRLTAPC